MTVSLSNVNWTLSHMRYPLSSRISNLHIYVVHYCCTEPTNFLPLCLPLQSSLSRTISTSDDFVLTITLFITNMIIETSSTTCVNRVILPIIPTTTTFYTAAAGCHLQGFIVALLIIPPQPTLLSSFHCYLCFFLRSGREFDTTLP